MGGRVPGGAADYPLSTARTLKCPKIDRDPAFVVGVIDTGLVLEDGQPHPFIKGHLDGYGPANEDRLRRDGQPGPHDGHGTFVAGLIHDEAPAATIHMLNALDKTGGSDGDALVAEQICALVGVPNLKLVNFSFYGEAASEKEEPIPIKRALEHLLYHHPDIVVVTAAGNRGTDEPVWPAKFNEDFEQVVVVGALDGSIGPGPPLKASFSSSWPGIDVYAPGVRVLGPYMGFSWDVSAGDEKYTGWSLWSGTSFAAATVTGRLAETMMKDHLSGATARERVIPRLFAPVPEIAAEQHWKPYLRERQPDDISLVR